VRVDVLRARFKMKIDNDPRRQLFVLDKALAHRNAKFLTAANPNLPSGHLRDGAGAIDSLAVESKRPRIDSPALVIHTGAANEQQQLAIAPENFAGLAMAKDEQVVRSRLTNAAALSQLGVPMKSWMMPNSSNSSDQASNITSAAEKTIISAPVRAQVANAATSTATTATLMAAQSAPLGPISYGISEKEWRTSVLERKLTIEDLLCFMSYDKALSHSALYTKLLSNRR
jgi:hypothetical protein